MTSSQALASAPAGKPLLIPVNLVFLALVAFVFWGRHRAPIQAR